MKVTWLRSSDSTVLSVGSDTFSSDSRLSVVHVNRSEREGRGRRRGRMRGRRGRGR